MHNFSDFSYRKMSVVPLKHNSGYHKIEKKRGLQSETKVLQIFQVCVFWANVCDYSSAASAVSALESAPEVCRTNDDDNQA